MLKQSFYLFVLVLFVSCQSPTEYSEQSSLKNEVSKIQLDPETIAILSAARAQIPIDTTGMFAYGVLDKKRTPEKCIVGFYNRQVYTEYEFRKNDDEWKIGQIIEKFSLISTNLEDNKGGKRIQAYTKAIAKIYTGADGDILRDTWYVPGNQQTSGRWTIEAQYVTGLPTKAEFISGNQISNGYEEIVQWVGPWEWRRYHQPTGWGFSNSPTTTTVISQGDTSFGAEELKMTYDHIIIQITVPSVPSLSSPPDNSFNDPPVTYVWNASSGNGTITYQLQVDDDVNFSSPFFNQSGLTSTSKFVNNHSRGVEYYWRVRSSNEAGSSAWSSVWSLTIRPATPSVSASIQNGYPKLSWPAADGATSYEIFKRTDTSSWDLYDTTTSNAYVDDLADVTGYQGTYAIDTPYVAYYVRSKGINGATSGNSSQHYYDLSGETPEIPTGRK